MFKYNKKFIRNFSIIAHDERFFLDPVASYDMEKTKNPRQIMFRFFLFLIGLFTFLQSGEITTPPTQLAKTDSALLEGGVTCCFIESTNQVFYTWAQTGLEEGSSQPYFALYNPFLEKFIIEKQLINQDYTDGVNIGVNCCYDSASNQVILCWADGTEDTNPNYIIYDVATQTFAPVKKIDENSAVLSMVGCCYNKTTNKVIFSWENNTTSNPVYTILSSDGSMTSPQNISTNQAFNNVYCCSAKSDKVIFSFSGSERDKIFIDVLNLNTLSKEEFELNLLPNKLSADVFCSYNSDSNQVILSWASDPDFNFWYPYYAFFDLGTSLAQTPQKLSTTPYEISGLPNINIYSCYNPIDKKVYFSWGAYIYNGGIYYAIYDPKIAGFPTPATPISKDYQIGIYSYGVYTCTGLNKVFFSWTDLEGEEELKQPWYAIYSFYLSLPQAVKKFSPLKYQR